MHLQNKFRKLGKSFGVKQTGYCHAFSFKVVEAVLVGKFETIEELVRQVKYQEDSDTVKNFFESMYVYGQPRKKFPKKKYSKADFQELSLLAGNQEIIAEGGLTSVYCHTNCYDDDQLRSYLLSLEQQLANSPLYSIPIVLSTATHKTVAIFTPSANVPWQFIDINNYQPQAINLNELMTKIKKGLVFSGTKKFREYLTFNTQIILTKQQETALKWRQQLTIPAIPETIEPKKYLARDGRCVVKAAYLAILYNEDALFKQILEHSPLVFLQNTIPTSAKKWSPLQLAAYLGKENYITILRSNPTIKAEINKSDFKFQVNFQNAISLAIKEKYPNIIRILNNIPTKSANQQVHIENLLRSLEECNIANICNFLLRCFAYGPESKLQQSDLNAAREQILAYFEKDHSEKQEVINLIKLFFQLDNNEVITLPEEAKAIEKWLTISLYPLARSLVKLEITCESEVNFIALNLCLIFNSSKNLIQYFAEFYKFNPAKPNSTLLQEAGLISLPNPNKIQFNFWKIIANKNKFMLTPLNRAMLTRAEDLENYHAILSADNNGNYQKQDQSDQSSTLLVDDKARANLNQLLTQQFNKLSEKQLRILYEAYISSTENLLSRYNIRVKYSAILHRLKPMNDDNLIPNIIINGADYGLPGFFASKLDTTTFKGIQLAAILGKLTYCCQSINGAAKSSVVYGIENRNSGFYIIYRGSKPEHQPSPQSIIGQSWVWRNEDKFCFDSLESGAFYRQLCKIFFNLLAIKLNGQYGINQITRGSPDRRVTTINDATCHISTSFLTSQSIYTDACHHQSSMDLDSCNTDLYNTITGLLTLAYVQFLFEENFENLFEKYLDSLNENPSLTQAVIISSWLSIIWIKFPDFLKSPWVNQYKAQLRSIFNLLFNHQKLHFLASLLQLLLVELQLDFPLAPEVPSLIELFKQYFFNIIKSCSKGIRDSVKERFLGRINAPLNGDEHIDSHKLNSVVLNKWISENHAISDEMFVWFKYCHFKSRYISHREIILSGHFEQALEIIQEFEQIKNPISTEMLENLEISLEKDMTFLSRLESNPALQSKEVKLVLLQLNKIIYSQKNHNPINLSTYIKSSLESMVNRELITVTNLFLLINREHGVQTAFQIFSLFPEKNDYEFIHSLQLTETIYILKELNASKLLEISTHDVIDTVNKCPIKDDKIDVIRRYYEAWIIYGKQENTAVSAYLFGKYLFLKYCNSYEVPDQFIENPSELELDSRTPNEESQTRLIENILAFQSKQFQLTDLKVLEQLLDHLSLQTIILQISTNAMLKSQTVTELTHYLGVEQSNYLNLYNKNKTLFELMFRPRYTYNLSDYRSLVRLFKSQESHVNTLKQFYLKITVFESFVLALNVLRELEPLNEFLTLLVDNQKPSLIREFNERYIKQLLVQLINYLVSLENTPNELFLSYEDSDFFAKLLSNKCWLTKLVSFNAIRNEPIIMSIIENVTSDLSNSLTNPHYPKWKALITLFETVDPEGIMLQNYCIEDDNQNYNLLTTSKKQAFNLLQDLIPLKQLKNWLTTIDNVSLKNQYLNEIGEKLCDYVRSIYKPSPTTLFYRNSFVDQILSDNLFFISILFSSQSKSFLREQLKDLKFRSLVTIVPENWSYEHFKEAGLFEKDIDFIMDFISFLQINDLLSAELLIAIFTHYLSSLETKATDILVALKSLSIEDSLMVIDSFPDQWRTTFSLALFDQIKSDLSKQSIAEFILRRRVAVSDEKANLLINKNRCLFNFIEFASSTFNPKDLYGQGSFIELFSDYLTTGSFETQDIRPRIKHWNFALAICSPTDFNKCKAQINIHNLFMYNPDITVNEWKTLINLLYNHYGKSVRFLCTLSPSRLPCLISHLINNSALLNATREAVENDSEFEEFIKHHQSNPVMDYQPVSIFFYQYFTNKQNIVWLLDRDIKECIESSWISITDLSAMSNDSLTPLSRIRRWAYMINNPMATKNYSSLDVGTLLLDSCNKECSKEAYDLIDAILRNSKISDTVKSDILNSNLVTIPTTPAKSKIRMFKLRPKQLPVEIINLINDYKIIQGDSLRALTC